MFKEVLLPIKVLIKVPQKQINEMKMISITRRQNSLSLSGGHIVSEQLMIPSYSPNAQPFCDETMGCPWEGTIDDINTPDIDPSFFDNGPFFKKSAELDVGLQMDLSDEDLFITPADQTPFTLAEDTNHQSIHASLEDNFDLSSLINQTTADSQQSMVSPNDVLENQYIPTTTGPVLHYLEPRAVESIASTVNLEFIQNTSLIDSLNSQSTVESLSHFSSPIHSSQSYSPTLSSVTQSYISPTPSPALSYTSATSCASSLVSSIETLTSDTNTTIDSLIEAKPEPEFLQPTVINDHLYTLPSKNTRKGRKPSSEKPSVRAKNNMASKKSRVSKRDKQKQMDEKIQYYIEDNAKCKKMIEDMERQIKWCKDFLFKKVVASAQS